MALLLVILTSACTFTLDSNSGTATPFIITATLPASPISPATWTLPPPTATATPIPVAGTTSTQVNVRANPTTGSTPLGIIGAFVKIQILGKDISGSWYQIAYPKGPDGKGWVAAQYVVVSAGTKVPVIGGAPASTTGTTTISSPRAVALQQVNVRSGPGTDFNSLGNLNPKDVVILTGKDPAGVWFQIQYTGGPNGKGWVTAAFVQASNAGGLPIIARSGTVVGTATPTSAPLTTTPTLIAAAPDGDSAQSPAVKVVFLASGTHSLIYSGDVSAPAGDAEDWVQFTPFTSMVSASLTCAGNGSLKIELWQNAAAIQDFIGLSCGESQQLDVSPGQAYLIRLVALSSNGTLEYVRYTLKIESTP